MPIHAMEHEDEEEAMAQAAFLVNSIMVPMMMKTAVELGVLDILADRGTQLTAEEVAGRVPAAVDAIERILRFLEAFSVVSSSVVVVDGEAPGTTTRTRLYRLTATGRYFVKNEDGVSMAPGLTLVTHQAFIQSYYKIKDAVLDGGIAFNKVHGMNAFEYPAIDPEFNDLFNLTMFGHTTILMKKVLKSYNGFENVHRLVDVGGGLGQTLQIILSKFPQIKAINFDLPHVTQNGLPHSGIEHIGGDMFEVIPSADVIFMKWILHDWSDEHCVKLLKNCHKAIPENGKVIVVELLVSEEPEMNTETRAITVIDMMMMTQNPGGKERTKNEFVALAMAAGFGGIRFECHVGSFSVMELYK